MICYFLSKLSFKTENYFINYVIINNSKNCKKEINSKFLTKKFGK